MRLSFFLPNDLYRQAGRVVSPPRLFGIASGDRAATEALGLADISRMLSSAILWRTSVSRLLLSRVL
jgi:hypothetical protein